MSQTELGKWLSKYFQQTTKLDQSSLQKLNLLLDRFASQQCQVKVVQMLFETMQNAISKENLKIIVKRYFYLMNIILERDDNTTEFKKYKNAISQEIVNHFIVILKHLLKYSMIDQILLAKIYRKKWAKRITDSAFQKINSQAMKKLNNFNLDRGFNQEHLDKITKGFQKRGFSSAEIEKYLSIKQRPRSQSPKQDPSELSEQQQSESPRKRVKKDPSADRGYTNKQFNERGYDPDMNPPSYFPSNPYPNHQHYPNNFFYPTYALSVPQHLKYLPMMQQQEYYHNNQQQQRYYPTSNPNLPLSSINNFYQPPLPTPTQSQLSPYQTSSYSRNQEPKKPRSDPYQKSRQLFRKLKLSQLYECKTCGVSLSTQENFSKHNYEHFLDLQKNFETSHSRRDPNILRRCYLPSCQEWITNSKKLKSSQIKHLVPIFEVIGNFSRNECKVREKCSICKGSLKMNWSDQLDTWVYEDAIKVNFESKGLGVTHFQCYQTIEDILAKDHMLTF